MANSGIPSQYVFNLHCILYKPIDSLLSNETFCNTTEPLLYFRAKISKAKSDDMRDMIGKFLYDKRILLIETIAIIPDEVKPLYLIKIENTNEVYMISKDNSIQRTPLYEQRQLVYKQECNYKTYINLTR